MRIEIFGKRCGIGAVSEHSEFQSFAAEICEICVKRSHNSAYIPHKLHSRFKYKRRHAALFDVNYAVITFVRLDKIFKTRIVFPIEVSAVDDETAHAGGVTVKIFGGRMNDDICAMLERTA